MRKIEKLAKKIASIQPWTNVYGLARTLLAIGTTLTLAFNDADILFRPIIESSDKIIGVGFSKLSIFYLFDPDLNTARIIAISILLLVIVGWRPRITGIFHWWISFSFMASSTLVDGGDQITSILTLFLLPVCFTDKRKWHWSTNKPSELLLNSKIAAIIAVSCLVIIRLQVAIIYLNAGVEKLRVTEWANGTALYYWMQNPVIGLNDWLKSFIIPLFSNPFVVAFSTWGIIVLEITLFTGLVMPKRYWASLLKIGLVFHLGIIIIHGLVSFFFAMTAALILYLRPIDSSFQYENILVNKLIGTFSKINFLNNKTSNSMEQAHFKDVQKINGWLLLSITIASLLIIIYSWRIGTSATNIIIESAGLLVMNIFLSMVRLTIEINDNKLLYKLFPFHWHMQTIEVINIESASSEKFNPLFWGIGLRYDIFRNTKGFIVAGSKGLKIVLKGGGKILFSTSNALHLIELMKLKNNIKLT